MTDWTRGEREPWMTDALCTQVDPELFHPEKGERATKGLEICGKCDVVAQCLEYAQKHNIRHGIWGGKTAEQRSRMRGRDAA